MTKEREASDTEEDGEISSLKNSIQNLNQQLEIKKNEIQKQLNDMKTFQSNAQTLQIQLN